MTHIHHTIDYIEIPVLDIAASKRFYGAAFDWEFVDYGPEYAGIKKADGGEAGGLAQRTEVSRGSVLVVLYSNDLELSRKAVIDAGGTIVTPPFEFPGGMRFHFTDPSGNELSVATYG